MLNAVTNTTFCSLACAVSVAIVLAVPQVSLAQPVEVREASLKRNCLDKGTSDRPLVGQEFEACLRKQIEGLPALDTTRHEHFGERYDPQKYVECRLQPGNRNSSACNVFILRRREWPEYWPDNAVRPKWPEAPKASVYREGMKPREYWEALCRSEAGEFVYKKVKDVKSIYNVRPHGVATDDELSDRFVLEDPFTYTDVRRSLKPEEYFVQPFLGRYSSYESRDPKDSAVLFRFFRSDTPTGPPYQTFLDNRRVRVPYVVGKRPIESVASRYSYTWRGITRPHDRELGIAGGELLIADLATGETLAMRRGFARSGYVPNKVSGFWWLSAERCPAGKGNAPNMVFIRSVLQSVPSVNAYIEPLER
jgi:hypothetical protein